MKKLVITSLAIVLPVTAFAADLPSKAKPVLPDVAKPSESSGFYFGVNAAGGSSAIGLQSIGPIANSDAILQANKFKRSGAMGGFQAGFAMQSGPLVYGVEADISLGALRGSLDTSGSVNDIAQNAVRAHIESRLDSFATLRVRMGYAFDNMLIYGTGGLASAHYEIKEALQATGVSLSGAPVNNPAGTPMGQNTFSQWAPGWTAGGGGEYAFSRNMSLRLEYLHAKMNTRVAKQDASHSVSLVRTGVNYRF